MEREAYAERGLAKQKRLSIVCISYQSRQKRRSTGPEITDWEVKGRFGFFLELFGLSSLICTHCGAGYDIPTESGHHSLAGRFLEMQQTD
jgi:hypothetical protein